MFWFQGRNFPVLFSFIIYQVAAYKAKQNKKTFSIGDPSKFRTMKVKKIQSILICSQIYVVSFNVNPSFNLELG